MSYTIYDVCPNCGKITGKKVITLDSTVADTVDYRKGERCSTPCYGRKANQAPEKRREIK